MKGRRQRKIPIPLKVSCLKKQYEANKSEFYLFQHQGVWPF